MTCVTVLCVLAISIGQLFFKQAATSIHTVEKWQDWLLNVWLVAALVLYGVATLVWVWVLREAPLRLAYPFMGLAFLIVPILGWIFLGEPLHSTTLIGGALILVGVAVAAQSA
jgi:drug/metabolite transporter (DMT)-like permease